MRGVFKQKSSIMARKAIASIPPATYGTSTAIQANIIPNDPLEIPDADPTPAVTNKTAPSFQLR